MSARPRMDNGSLVDNSSYPEPVREYLAQRRRHIVSGMAAVEPPADANAAQQATQLEFRQAMQDFKTMFPDMDEDVIEAVLRANQGAVDATIDQLLTMSTDNENERLRTEMDAADNAESPPSYSPTTPPPSYQQAVPGTTHTPPHSPAHSAACDLLSSSPASGSIGPSLPIEGAEGLSTSPKSPCHTPLRTSRNWQPPLLGPLPADFLRIAVPHSKSRHTREMRAVLCSEIIQQKLQENERQRRMGGCDDPELVRYLEDERIALFLQNEEFMQELRRNKDFMTTLERDTQSRKEFAVAVAVSDSETDDTEDEVDKPPEETTGPFPFTKTLPLDDADADFREKLKNMGKMSRRKFAQLARLFTRRKKRSAKQILSDGAVPSRDNLLLEDEDDLDESGDEISEQRDDRYDGKPLCSNGSSPERSQGPTA